MKFINVILFDEFTALDVFGAIEVFSRLKEIYNICYFSLDGGLVRSSINLSIDTKSFNEIKNYDILLVPGGFGTRTLVNNDEFLSKLRDLAKSHEYILSVCTGSVLLAKAGMLDGLCATSNKSSWNWVVSQNLATKWVKKARWVVDGKFYTSSGVAAGIDMALGFVADIHTKNVADEISKSMEYLRNADKSYDVFGL